MHFFSDRLIPFRTKKVSLGFVRPSLVTRVFLTGRAGKIGVWVHRGACPHAVESTANFFSLMLSERQNARQTKVDLRLAYAMAIVRCAFVPLRPDAQ